MIQSKSIDIIKSFNKKEISGFIKYLDSPFLNSNKNLIKLFNGIKKYYPAFNSSKLTKESVFRHVYPGKSYDDLKLRKLFSDLNKEAERFMVLSAAEKNKTVFNKLLLEELDIRKLDNLFISKMEQHSSYLDNTYHKTDNMHYDYFLEKHLAEWKNIMFHLERGLQKKIVLRIYKRTEYLIFYFLSDFFLSFQDNLSNLSRFNTKVEVDLGNEFLKNFNIAGLFEFILKNDFEDKTVLNAYYRAFLAFRNFEDRKYYAEYKKFVVKHIDQFNEGTKRMVTLYLINYCVRKKRISNDKQIRMELNDNYNLYIKYRLYRLSGENYFRTDLFLNIMSNYFDIGKIKESEDFLLRNIEVIQPSHRNNMRTFCTALIEFEKGNYGASLGESSKVKSDTLMYRYHIKFLNTKNHYELRNFDIAKEALNSFRKSINKDDSLTDMRRSHIIDYLNYYNTLWKFHENPPNQDTVESTIRTLKKNSPVPEGNWLLKKFAEFRK